MKDIMATPSRAIQLGRLGENIHRRVLFPIAEYLEMYDNPSFTLLNQLPGAETAYPVATIETDDSYLYWTVTNSDLTVEGQGNCELIVRDGDAIAKSTIYITGIRHALDGSGEAPDPLDNWLTRFNEIKYDTEQAADRAVDAAEDVEAAKDAAETARDEAVAAKEAAEEAGLHYPIIENGEWLVWDVHAKAYVPSGVQATGEKGDKGDTGTTFTPAVSSAGVISWTNDGGKTNPEPVDIRGPKGDKGDDGVPYVQATAGPENVVTVSDALGEEPLTIFYVDIFPSQAGSGTPSPDNIRKINTFNDFNIYQGGADQADSTAYLLDMPYDIVGGQSAITATNPDRSTFAARYSTTIIRETSQTGAFQRIQPTGADFYVFSIYIDDTYANVSASILDECLCSHYNVSVDTLSPTESEDLTMTYASGVYYIRDDRFETAADFKAYANAQFSASTPITFCGHRRMPVVSTFAGPSIVTRNNTNTFWSDVGQTTISYKALPGEYIKNHAIQGEKGDTGTTFTPAVSSEGVISWTNDGDKPNPQPMNIRGPQGNPGPAGVGVPTGGTTGQVLAKASDTNYDTEWVDQSGGSGNDVFLAEYNVTTEAELNEARLAGKTIVCKYSERSGLSDITVYAPLYTYSSRHYRFTMRGMDENGYTHYITQYRGTWGHSTQLYNAIASNGSVAAGNALVFTGSLDRLTKSSNLTFGTDANKYLANNGTWQDLNAGTVAYDDEATYDEETVGNEIGVLKRFITRETKVELTATAVNMLYISGKKSTAFHLFANAGSAEYCYYVPVEKDKTYRLVATNMRSRNTSSAFAAFSTDIPANQVNCTILVEGSDTKVDELSFDYTPKNNGYFAVYNSGLESSMTYTFYEITEGIHLVTDKTLKKENFAADAKAVGDSLDNKLDAPATAGTSGQVLTSDGQGGQSWQTPSGGGAVESVNGQTGAVVLDAGGLGYDDQETYDAGTVGAELGDLKTRITAMNTATASDEGKALIAKTVSGGKVTEWEFGEIGGGSSEYQFVPQNLIDPDNLVGTMTINGSSVSGLSNWILVKKGAFYITDYTYTQFYLFDPSKNYVSTTTRISAINRFQVDRDGYLLIRISGDLTKKIVRGSYLEYGKGIVSRWNNKKWLAIGDSITDIQYASEGYPYWVGSNLGMEVTNVGTSGKTMAWFHDLIDGYADDYDLITVLLGTNNQGYNTAIGALNDQYYQEEDYDSNNSFFAQTQRLADLLIAKYPKTTIAFLTPIRRSVSSSDGADNTNALGLTTQAYADAIMDVCDYYSLPCLDLYKHGINPRYAANRANYFVNGDGTHPNDRGHARFTSPVINEFFCSLAPFVIVEMVSISAVYNGTDVPVGTDVSTLDVTVTGHYSDGSTEEITDYTISGTIAAGENTVTIIYGDFTTTITVTGETMVLSSITAVYNGGNVLIGTDVDDLDITVTAHYTNGYSETLTDGYTVSGTIASGQNTVTITYGGFTATVTVTGVSSVLIHSYTYSATYEDGLVDSVGSKDLAYYSNGKRLYNDEIGNEHLSSFSIVWAGVSRTSNYFSQIPYLTTAVKLGVNGNPHTNTGDRIALAIRASSGTYGDGYARLQVDISNTPDSYYGQTVIANNSTHTFVLTFDASTKKYCVYVDGTLEIEQVSDALCAVDGLTVEQANYIANGAWTGLQIYSGVVDIGSIT